MAVQKTRLHNVIIFACLPLKTTVVAHFQARLSKLLHLAGSLVSARLFPFQMGPYFLGVDSRFMILVSSTGHSRSRY